MASRTCPACGLVIPATSRFCRNCGTPIETAASDARPAPPQPPQGNPAPYANPAPYDNPAPYANPPAGYGAPTGLPSVPAYGGPPVAPWSTAGVWQQKNMLVMHKNATLPDRCVKCNKPANGRKLTKKYMWLHPAWALTILAGLLIYLLIMLIVRKQAVLSLGLCDEHFSKRRVGIGVGLGAVVFSVALFVLGVSNNLPALALLSIPVFFFGLIYAVFSANVITIKKIDDQYVWMRRVNKDYLLMLPELP